MNAPQRRFIFESTLLLITALLLTFFSIREEWAAPLDRILYDFYVGQYQAPRHPDVVIVSIDDSSLHTYGPWPWPRDLQAKLLRRVQSHKPSLVAADVIYTGNSSTDAELVAAAQQLPILALPVMIERLGYDRQHIEVMPYPELLGVTDLLGHVHVELDDDALVRGTFLYQGIHTPHWPHLMLAIARQLRGLPAAPATCASAPETLLTIRKCDYVRLPFAGPPGTYPQIPAELLLADEASQANLLDRALQNKVVIVGLTATGVGDWVTSPTSPTGSDVGPMSGVEFNANLLSALYYDSTISTPPLWWAVLLGCGIVTLCSLTLPRLRPKQMLIITAVLTVTPVLITWLSLAVFAAYLPLATASVAVLVIYPLWSWRRHEIAWSFIQGELNRVGDESRQLHSTITWHTSHKQPAEIVEHLKVMLGTDLNLAMLVPDKANDLQENPAIEVLSEPAREILRDTRLMLTRDTPEPGLPGEILAKQIRKLQFRAQEVREGRAIGLAGLGRMNNGALIISALGEVRFM
ncbi:MAG: CHASE2 domain-containing protein, partial [Pseudomonadota bacterium]